MPRKNNEGAPQTYEDKISDESRKEIFGKSELESAPEDKDHNRHHNGPSPSGSPDSAGSDRGS